MAVPSSQMSLPLPLGDDRISSKSIAAGCRVRWSYSRRGVFEQCLRRYFYEYYALKAAATLPVGVREQLVLLKKLQNRHERAGNIAHLVIAVYLRKAQTGDLWQPGRLAAWAKTLFEQDLAYSSQYRGGPFEHRGKIEPILLQEYFYQDPDRQRFFEETLQKLLDGLRAFVESSEFEEFRLAGVRPGALVERNVIFKVQERSGYGKVDLAFESEDRATVVDWKLGEAGGTGEESLQLGAYALWAVDAFHVPTELLRICKAHLQGCRIVDFAVTTSVLASVRARIRQDLERMELMDKYGRQGESEAFTPCAKPNVCRLCPYRAICPEGRATLNA